MHLDVVLQRHVKHAIFFCILDDTFTHELPFFMFVIMGIIASYLRLNAIDQGV